MTIVKAVLWMLVVALATVTGSYFLFRRKEQRKQDRETLRNRLGAARFAVTGYCKSLWNTDKKPAVEVSAAAAR